MKNPFHGYIQFILWAAILVLLSPAVTQAAVVTELAKLLASDGAADDQFGKSVAISGDTAVVGAHIDDGHGSAYVFVRDGGGNWIQQAKLVASDAAPDKLFGDAVAISGDTVIVGDSNLHDTGSAYIFVKPVGGWGSLGPILNEDVKLLASDGLPGIPGGVAGSNFGSAVAIDGDTVAVGARLNTVTESQQGSAYVFVKPAGGWDSLGPVLGEDVKLLASDPERLHAFGLSVAVSGDTVFVGAPGDDDNGSISGSAYVFVKPGGGWATGTDVDGAAPGIQLNEDAELHASDGEAGDSFGVRVACSGDTLVVGAHLDDDNGSSSGSAYVFVRDGGGTWN